MRVRLKGLVLKWVFVAYCNFKCKIHHCTENLQSLKLKRLIEDEGEAVCELVSIMRRDLRKNKKSASGTENSGKRETLLWNEKMNV